MSSFKNRVGQKFGRLIIINYAGKNKWGRTYWNCKCDCGEFALVSNNSLVQGHTKSCGCLAKERCIKKKYTPKIRDLLNQKIGKLLVIEKLSSNKDGRVLWRCRCDCGKETIIVGNDIGRRTNSCGCLQKESYLGKTKFSVDYSLSCPKKELPEGAAGFNRLYKTYRQNAIKRNKDFTLSIEDFKILTKQDCFYCGIPPQTHIKAKGELGTYIYNGIDRVDNNNKGYTLENCVSCCTDCNIAKKSKSLEEFKTWLIRTYKYFIKN